METLQRKHERTATSGLVRGECQNFSLCFPKPNFIAENWSYNISHLVQNNGVDLDLNLAKYKVFLKIESCKSDLQVWSAYFLNCLIKILQRKHERTATSGK